MTETYEHNPGDHEDPLAGPTYFIGLLGVLLLVIILGSLTAIYYGVKRDKLDEQVIRQRREEVLRLHEQQQALLEGPPRWVEVEEAGEPVRRYVIPIDRAMELVAQEREVQQ